MLEAPRRAPSPAFPALLLSGADNVGESRFSAFQGRKRLNRDSPAFPALLLSWGGERGRRVLGRFRAETFKKPDSPAFPAIAGAENAGAAF